MSVGLGSFPSGPAMRQVGALEGRDEGCLQQNEEAARDSQAGAEAAGRRQELCGAGCQVGAEPELWVCPSGEGLGPAAHRSLGEAWEELVAESWVLRC